VRVLTPVPRSQNLDVSLVDHPVRVFPAEVKCQQNRINEKRKTTQNHAKVLPRGGGVEDIVSVMDTRRRRELKVE